MPPQPNGVEPVLRLIAAMVVFFTILLFVSAKFFPSDGQTFQVISGLLTGFAGALLGRVKPADKHEASGTPPPIPPQETK